jgi:hypothetical protein
MPDVLSQGGDREPSPQRRRLLAAAVVVALIAVVIFQIASHRHSVPQSARTEITAGPVPPRPSSPPPVPVVPGGPSGIIGQTLRWDSGLRLPVTGAQPVWFWPATGRRQVIGGLPFSTAGYSFIRIGGGWAIQPTSTGQPGCGSCDGQPSPVYFLADRAQSAARIGRADQVAPAAVPGALWLTDYPPRANLSTAAGTAQQVQVSGAPLGPPVRLAAGYEIDQATDRGLLLTPSIPRPGVTTDRLWNPAAPGGVITFAGVIAAGANGIALASRCAASCGIRMIDLVTGENHVVALPAGTSVASAAFSPDGGFLALQVSSASGDGDAATQLEVASAASGRLTPVPGTGTSSDALVGFGWPSDADRLVAEFSFTVRVQVAAWRPGGTRLAVAAIRPGLSLTSVVVG